MSQQIIPSYREKNYVCARNRSPEVFNAQLLDQNVARHSICPVPNHYPLWLDWKGSEFHHKKVQKSKSAVVQGLEGISTSTVTGGPGGPGGPGEGLRVGLRLAIFGVGDARAWVVCSNMGAIKRGNPVWKMDQNGTKFG